MDTKKIVRLIIGKSKKFPEIDQRRVFAQTVVEPPVEGGLARRLVAADQAFWSGYEGTRRAGAEQVPWEAGRYRRQLEDKGLLPRAGGVDVASTPMSRHADESGFVHARLGADGADYVIYDRERGGEWLDGDERWAACRYLPDGTNTGVITFPTRVLAMSAISDAARGEIDQYDWGQVDGLPRP